MIIVTNDNVTNDNIMIRAIKMGGGKKVRDNIISANQRSFSQNYRSLAHIITGAFPRCTPYCEHSSASLCSASMYPCTETGPHLSIQATWTGRCNLPHSLRILGSFPDKMFLWDHRWNHVARMLLNLGDTTPVEEWVYTSALAAVHPIDVHWKRMTKVCILTG